MSRLHVYVAGPYRQGDPLTNTLAAIDHGDLLWSLGYCPFIPHLNHFWHRRHPRSDQQWLDYDNHWLRCCDLLYRLPGASAGADAEVELARSLGIPVVESLNQLVDRKSVV